jgi:hypothetical protein
LIGRDFGAGKAFQTYPFEVSFEELFPMPKPFLLRRVSSLLIEVVIDFNKAPYS